MNAAGAGHFPYHHQETDFEALVPQAGPQRIPVQGRAPEIH